MAILSKKNIPEPSTELFVQQITNITYYSQGLSWGFVYIKTLKSWKMFLIVLKNYLRTLKGVVDFWYIDELLFFF